MIFEGVMGSAILSGLLESCTKTEQRGDEPRFTKFIACVNSKGSGEALKSRYEKYGGRLKVLQQDNIAGMRQADVVILGCKPYMAEKVLTEHGVRDALAGKLTISVLAGSPVEKLRNFIYHAPDPDPKKECFIARAMPNIAAEFGESMTAIETEDLPEELVELTNWIFQQLGKTTLVASDLYNVASVMAGLSGVLLGVAVDGILDGAVHEGLKRPQARAIVTQTLRSLARLLEEGNTPDMLREKFSSPRGTTIVALMALEEGRARHTYSDAILKATHRSRTM